MVFRLIGMWPDGAKTQGAANVGAYVVFYEKYNSRKWHCAVLSMGKTRTPETKGLLIPPTSVSRLIKCITYRGVMNIPTLKFPRTGQPKYWLSVLKGPNVSYNADAYKVTRFIG